MKSLLSLLIAVSIGASACGNSVPPTQPGPDVGVITINQGSLTLERGFNTTLTTTIRNKLGIVVTVPVVWRSLDEKVVTVDANGRLTAVDTGVASVFASSLGVNSSPIQVRVVWTGPAKIEAFQFKAPTAVSPGATPDSVRARVTNLAGNPVANARVAFAVTGGGGTISPAIATTNALGIASAEWKLGTAAGPNTATATVLGVDDKPFAFVTPNMASFSLSTFAALEPAQGDGQSGLILAALPINPSVRVVDSTGKVRQGVPVTFTAGGGGRVASTQVSTGADGTASPGVWTLGDMPGEQILVAKVEFATVTLKATATGTPVFYTPNSIVAGGFANCAINIDNLVSCWGEQPKVGDSTLTNAILPRRVRSDVPFVSLGAGIGSPSHFCGVSFTQSIYCWGQNALTDTAGIVNSVVVPTQVISPVAFTRVAPGTFHNCALTTEQAVYCWGDNSVGQLGDRTTKVRFVPGIVYGGFKFTTVSSGSGHTCSVTTDGAGFCWGLNQNGQLGDGTTASRPSPTAVGGSVNFVTISAGESFSCGLTTLGRAYCWGNLGTGSTVVTTPRTYAAAPDFASISTGKDHACALTADGSAYCWGSNTVGQLGDSTFTERPAPTPVVTKLKFKAISAGFGHTCAQTLDQAVACWGLNRAGELGDSASAVPVRTTPRYLVLEVKP